MGSFFWAISSRRHHFCLCHGAANKASRICSGGRAEELASNRAFQLMTERPFPWSREVWALLLDRLFGAGARLVIFDLMFNPPNDGDPAFHAALDRYHDKVVVG